MSLDSGKPNKNGPFYDGPVFAGKKITDAQRLKTPDSYCSIVIAPAGQASEAAWHLSSTSLGTSSLMITAFSPCILKTSGQVWTQSSLPTQASWSTLTFIFSPYL